MAAKEMTDYIENGNIVNSVNYPRLSSARVAGKARVCVLYKADSDAAAKAAAVFGARAVQSASAVRGAYGYAVIDADATETDKAAVEAVDGVIKVRLI
jgi:D-3-phosphoglycerate dehydrogenase